MHFVLNKAENVTEASLKKVEHLLESNSVLLNRANYCGHCHAFTPEFNKYKNMALKQGLNIVELESSALHEISAKHSKLYKKVTAKDGLYFPMVIIYIKGKKTVYNGPRMATDLNQHVKEKLVKTVPKKKKNKTI